MKKKRRRANCGSVSFYDTFSKSSRAPQAGARPGDDEGDKGRQPERGVGEEIIAENLIPLNPLKKNAEHLGVACSEPPAAERRDETSPPAFYSPQKVEGTRRETSLWQRGASLPIKGPI